MTQRVWQDPKEESDAPQWHDEEHHEWHFATAEVVNALEATVADLRDAKAVVEVERDLLKQDVDDLRRQLEERTRERDAFANTIRLLTEENLTVLIPRMETAEQQLAQERALVEDLAKYGTHRHDCPGFVWPTLRDVCTCGLDAALARCEALRGGG